MGNTSDRRRVIMSVVGVVGVVAFLGWSSGRSAEAASIFTVSTTSDAVDSVPGDGFCDDGFGNCTLRAAIQESNALAGPDLITLPAGTYSLSIPGANDDAAATGDLDITDDVTITGDGPAVTIVDGSALDRVFHVHPTATVEITDLGIRNGAVFGFGSSVGGGVWNQGTLVLANVIASGNRTADSEGGGIQNEGTMTVRDSIVVGNRAGNDGGGIHSAHVGDCCRSEIARIEIIDTTISENSAGEGGSGGGLFTEDFASVLMIDSVVQNNDAIDAGGISIGNDAVVSIIRSSVTGNIARDDAGGLFNDGGTLSVVDSTISDNSAPNRAGALYNDGGRSFFLNSTVSGNSASIGGAIFNGGAEDDHELGDLGTVTLVNTTMSDNVAANASSIFNNAGLVGMKNTIISSGPGGNNCVAINGGLFLSLGHNLGSDATCGLSATGDLSSVDPQLGELADNGGPTRTQELLTDSPALDAIPLALCTDVSDDPILTDQRNIVRPQNADCDIGAYEAKPVLEVELDIKPGSDPNSIECTAANHVITVAVLTTAAFDATTLDHTTVAFDNARETHLDRRIGKYRRHQEDVDNDGDTDLLFHFRLADTAVTCQSVIGTVTGSTFTGQLIRGTGDIRIVRAG